MIDASEEYTEKDSKTWKNKNMKEMTQIVKYFLGRKA